MTQGAIDLVQAELNDFLPSQPLLLQDKPQAGPTYIATRQPATRTPMTQLINSYSWWDAGAHVCLSIPIPATYLGCTAEICAQRQAVRITFQSASADKEAVHTLSIDPLYAEIRPEASACTVEEMPVSDKHGETCRPDKASLPKKFMQAIADGIDSHVASPEQPSKDGPRQSLPSVTLKIQQASDHSTDIGLVSHQPTSVTDIVAAHDKHSTRILVTLVKLNTREPWLTLTGLKPAQQHKVPRPPNAADMAALRRTLITQRQQRQCSQAHPQATKQAVLEDASSSLSQSLIDDQPDNAAIDTTMKQQKLAASNSCETKQHPPLDGQAHQAALQVLKHLDPVSWLNPSPFIDTCLAADASCPLLCPHAS